MLKSEEREREREREREKRGAEIGSRELFGRTFTSILACCEFISELQNILLDKKTENRSLGLILVLCDFCSPQLFVLTIVFQTFIID